MTNPRLTKFEVNKPSSMTCGRNPPLPWHGDSPSAIRDIWADVVAKPKACGTARSHFGIALGWLVYELTTPMNRCMKIGCLPKKQKTWYLGNIIRVIWCYLHHIRRFVNGTEWVKPVDHGLVTSLVGSKSVPIRPLKHGEVQKTCDLRASRKLHGSMSVSR